MTEHEANFGRIDLHVTSRATSLSNGGRGSFGLEGSTSDPFRVHNQLRSRGMTLVTLLDRETLDGNLELLAAGHRDVFPSACISASFPEDGCRLSIGVLGLDEEQLREMLRLRENLYDLAAYLASEAAPDPNRPREPRLGYFVAQPLHSGENRPYGRAGSLTVAHLEKALLLFPGFEVRHGASSRTWNEILEQTIARLDRAAIERIANRHDLAPLGESPWSKFVVGGSGDRSELHLARAWTAFHLPNDGPAGLKDLLRALLARTTRAHGAHGGPLTAAHALLKVVHDAQRSPRPAAKAPRLRGPLRTMLRLAFEPQRVGWLERVNFGFRAALELTWSRITPRRAADHRSFERVLFGETLALAASKSFRAHLAEAPTADEKVFRLSSALSNRLLTGFAKRATLALARNPLCAWKQVVELCASNALLSFPYLLAYLEQGSGRRLARDVRRSFALEEAPKLVLVTDTLFEVNGVSRTIARMIDEAESSGIDFTVVTCLGAEEREELCAPPHVRRWLESGRLVVLTASATFDCPHYPGLALRVPPFLDFLQHLQEAGYTKMQISTPGPLGISGLIAAKILQLETSATYHTCFPEYVEDLTRDRRLEALAWRFVIRFYHAVDEVVVPSKFVARLLHERGLRKRSLLVLDRWVDLRRFHPAKRQISIWERHGLSSPERYVKFVYVGRVSVEKNLRLLAEAYRAIRARHSEARLVVIGDGPFRAELAELLRNDGAIFTGMLEGESLAIALASCDAKLFPSTTDTWGNAPLEAQASGLPVVVSDLGGPQELMLDGITGIKVRGGDLGGLIEAMERLLDPVARERMGRAARAFVEQNRVARPFRAILDSAAYRRAARVSQETVTVDLDPRESEPTLAATFELLSAPVASPYEVA